MTAAANPVAAKPTAPGQERREPWSPTPRDEAIFREVRVAGRSQAEVASDWGLHQSTVSRILKRFALWRGKVSPGEQDEPAGCEERRLSRWLETERHEAIYAQAMRLARRMEQPAVTQKSGERGETQFSEETKRDQHAAAAKFLLTAQRSADAISRLSQAEEAWASKKLDEPEIKAGVLRLRQQAEEDGRVPQSNPYATVHRWMAALTGEGMLHSIDPDSLARDAALGEMVSRVMSNCYAGDVAEMLRRLADQQPPPPPPEPSDDEAPCDDEDAPAADFPTHHSPTHHSPCAPPAAPLPVHTTHTCISPTAHPGSSEPADPPRRTSIPFSACEPLPPGTDFAPIRTID